SEWRDSLRATFLDPASDDSWRCAGRLQRRLGARKVRRRHVLLRAGRGPASDRRCGSQRPDAGGARNPLWRAPACFAVRPCSSGRVHADFGDAAPIRLLPALSRTRPAGHHRAARGGARRRKYFDRCGSPVAAFQLARSAVRDHCAADDGSLDSGGGGAHGGVPFHDRASAGDADGTRAYFRKNSTGSTRVILQCLPCFSSWHFITCRRGSLWSIVRSQSSSSERSRLPPSSVMTSMVDTISCAAAVSSRISSWSTAKPG